jgi:hypothetical protein
VRSLSLILFLLAGCGGVHRDAPSQAASTPATETIQPAPGTYAIGAALTPDGAIAQHAAGDHFVRGTPVFVSIDVTGATTDHSVEIDWTSESGWRLRHDERLAPKGSHRIAVSSGPTVRWPPGTYRVVILIDGRRVNEQSFSLS